MFSLNKSLAKLKSALENANLAKKETEDASSKGQLRDDAPKKKKQKTGAQKKAAKRNNNVSHGGGKQSRGVIMIKNFPHGFYEKQMFDYFSQFGEVTRLKIVRSRKTGKPRNYGFIEFQFEDVAKIAAETMNNYLMFDHVVKCTILPEEKVPKNLFLNWNRPFISSVKTHKVAHNRAKSDAAEYALLCKRLKRIHNMEKTLAEKGIDFKCVVVNRPTGLSKPKRTDKAKPSKSSPSPKAAATARPAKTMKQVVLKSPSTTSIRPGRTVIRRRMMLPKFKVLQAGFNYARKYRQ